MVRMDGGDRSVRRVYKTGEIGGRTLIVFVVYINLPTVRRDM
jgi:hypothetical protein